MTMKVALADVLWDAANRWLAIEGFSCHATAAARFGKRWRAANWHTSSPMLFLISLGCNPDAAGFKDYFEEYEQMGARYMWLLLAMHVAEDEQIYIEVEA